MGEYSAKYSLFIVLIGYTAYFGPVDWQFLATVAVVFAALDLLTVLTGGKNE